MERQRSHVCRRDHTLTQLLIHPLTCRCGPGGVSFGVEAAELWSRWMLLAEGAISFQKGYERLLEKYADDAPRRAYITELYNDPKKAHFKQQYKFRNGTLVDVCESLMSAVKTWVCGKSRKGASLLMAIVRIVEGCREMIIRPYLKCQRLTTKSTVDRTECWPVVKLFKHCIKHLTAWAVKKMYGMIDRIWLSYEMVHAEDEVHVTRRTNGDSFIVRWDCSCWYRNEKCWQQTYRGLPCNHAVIATLERLRVASRDKEAQAIIFKNFVDSCHENWLRRTYLGVKDLDIYKPPAFGTDCNTKITRVARFVRRFRQVLPFVSAKSVDKLLHRLESVALEPSAMRDKDSSSDEDAGITTRDRDSSSDQDADSESDSGVSETNLVSGTTVTRRDIGSLLDPPRGPARYRNPRKRSKTNRNK